MVKLLPYKLEITSSNLRNNLLQSRLRLRTIDSSSGSIWREFHTLDCPFKYLIVQQPNKNHFDNRLKNF